MNFPNRSSRTGSLLNNYLKTLPSDVESKGTLNDRSVHLVFSANRWDELYLFLLLMHMSRDEIKKILESGTHIVCDRYSYSGVAFTAAKVIRYLRF